MLWRLNKLFNVEKEFARIRQQAHCSAQNIVSACRPRLLSLLPCHLNYLPINVQTLGKKDDEAADFSTWNS